ncbi:MAG TPA: BBP7 family outer membrane beta-barrel protein, partial [Gemmataceae bacterium]|nr:BBP7 family outer membrane beta-barrel protein [Gemmataceae bacterium]
MRYGAMIAVAAWLFWGANAPAQEPPTNDLAGREAPPPKSTPAANGEPAADTGAAGKGTATDTAKPPENCPPYHGWVRAEYLFWWMRNSPLPVPIVTTGNPRVGFDPNNVNTVNTAGAIGQPGTRVLFGDESMRFAPFSGGRLGFGVWFDDDETFGVDGSGFFIERLTHNFSLTSDTPNSLPLYFPIFSSIAGAERAIPIADPLR